MSIAEKLTTIAENEKKVYDVGKEQSLYRAAQQAQNFGQKSTYSYWKHTEDITDLKIPCPMQPTNCQYMFLNATTSDNSLIDLSQFDIDFSKCQNFNYWMQEAPIYKIGTLDTTSASSLTSFFINASHIQTIEHLILKEDGSQSLGKNVFANARKLENINQISGKFGQSFEVFQTYSISHETLVRILEALYDYSDTGTNPTIVIRTGGGAGVQITDEEQAIATRKGWTISCS